MSPDLVEWLGSVSDDPEAFVMGAFPWGMPGSRLENEKGPEQWQRDILTQIRNGLPLDKAIQLATASGHGIGKSACVSWIILWAISTLPDTRGVVTANTETQLKTKTWAELGKWYHMFIGKELFDLTATALISTDKARERTWRIDMVPWSEKNTEAFAGMHNKGRRILVLFDEASAIPDIIWETTEGALTDSETQIIWAVFGNPTRNIGRFRECFPGQRFAKYWYCKQVDSREVSFTNKAQIAKWIDAYGEDSDFVRIRVKGVFPRTGEMEFISAETADEAGQREAISFPHDALVIGVDVARYGSAESVIQFRKGRDARTIPAIRLRGVNTVELAAKVSELYHQYRIDAVFVDGGGVGGGVVDNLRALNIHCFDIQFGAKDDTSSIPTDSSGERYANKRAGMWGAMRAWLKTGAIPPDADLRNQLVAPTYTFNIRNQIQLEPKEDMMKRGVDSPDWADALALTFAYQVAASAHAGGIDAPFRGPLVESEYDPFAPERMSA